LVLAWSSVLSKFLTKLLHLSIHELVLSITHRALTGTKPPFPIHYPHQTQTASTFRQD